MIYIDDTTTVLNLPRTLGQRREGTPAQYYTKAEIDAMMSAVDGRLDADDASIADLEQNKADITEIYTLETVDLLSLPLENYYIKDDGTYNSTNTYKHVMLPVSPMQIYTITAPADRTSAYAYTTTNVANPGGSAHYVPGTGKMRLDMGESVTVRIPEGTAYLYFYGGNTATGTGQEGLPTLVKYVPVTRVVPVYNSLDSVATVKTAGEEDQQIIPVQTLRPYARFIGKGYNFASGTDYSRVLGVISGHTYRVHIIDTNPDMTGATGGYRYETIYALSDGTTDIYNRVNVGTALKDHYDSVAPEGAVSIHIGGRCAEGLEFGAWIEDLGDLSFQTSILYWNPESEWKPKMQAANKRYYTSSNNNLPYPLVIAHISDIHGNWANVARYLEFCDKYSEYIDEKIQTGDLVTQYYTNSINGYINTPGSEKIINVIGNHDTYHSGGTWAQHAGLDAYNKFIAPFVSNWGVTQPSDAATVGKCYFYKDYAEEGVRLAFVDAMGWDADEKTWLAGVLSDARTLGRHVMVVVHFAGNNPPAQASDPVFTVAGRRWSTSYTIGTSGVTLNYYNTSVYELTDTVQDFMDAGGVFIGYLQGHYHKDFAAHVARHPRQMIYAIGGSLRDEVSDYSHEAGTKMQDEFEIVSINTYTKRVTLYKVGANIDLNGTVKQSLCIDYENSQIFFEN